ncbi:hypothetical protein JYT16_00330 [Gemmatimonas aurantiaca]|nr:hypothetical protein [Gemmatimonas aurantiaca]
MKKAMKMTFLRKTVAPLVSMFCVMAGVTGASASQINFYENYDKAVAAANESGKPVMIDFYFDT